MDINKDELRIWIAALRSGEYQQAICYLQNSDGYCCLGVACRVLIPEDKLKVNEKGFLVGGHPWDQPHAPQWLMDINDHFSKHHGGSLTVMNDSGKISFIEIADKLEKAYLSDDTSTTANT